MTPDDPHTPTSTGPASEPGAGPGAQNPLDELSERVRAAQETAERLVREATETAQHAAGGPDPAGGPPPRGYASPGSGGRQSAEAQALVALLDLGRTVLPAELRHQFTELVRELLLLVRALIDWYLERIDARRRAPVEVEDIPIS